MKVAIVVLALLCAGCSTLDLWQDDDLWQVDGQKVDCGHPAILDALRSLVCPAEGCLVVAVATVQEFPDQDWFMCGAAIGTVKDGQQVVRYLVERDPRAIETARTALVHRQR